MLLEGIHRFIAGTPSALSCISLVDMVGDMRAQNQPGTTDEYPNWRVPLSGPDGEPLSLEEVFRSECAARLAAVMNDFSVHAIGRR